jgi:hypothetical protein
LIALSINNWKEENSIHKKQIGYLESIRNEMANNLLASEFEETKVTNKSATLVALLKVLYSSEAINTISDKAAAKLYYDSFNSFIETRIESGALQEIIVSGGLKDIKNDSIRKLLASWEAKLEPIRLQETNIKGQ